MKSPEIHMFVKSPERQGQTVAPAQLTWKDIEKSVNDALRQMYEEAHLTAERSEESDQVKDIERLQRNENIFFTKVLNAVEGAQKHYKGITVLFDVDETIAKRIYTSGNIAKTVLRPTAIPLMHVLKNNHRCRLGLFTTRGDLEKQVQDPLALAQIRPYMDTSLLICTKGYGPENDSNEFAENLQRNFGGPSGIVDDSLIPANVFDRPSLDDDMRKLTYLRDNRGALPKGAIIIVDDRQYPTLLNNRNGLYGVSLDGRVPDSGKFYL